MVDYAKLRAADQRVRIEAPDEAAAAIRSLTDIQTLDVAINDIRNVLLQAGEYGVIDMLYLTGGNGDFSQFPKVPGLSNYQILAILSTCLVFLNSGLRILAATPDDWTATIAKLGMLEQISLVSPASLSAVSALRNTQQLTISESFTTDDVISARLMFP